MDRTASELSFATAAGWFFPGGDLGHAPGLHRPRDY